MLDLDFVRSQFPALDGDWTYLDNAGGSQVLASVADRVSDYLLHTNVQLGASYEVSRTSGQRVADATAAIAEAIGAASPEEVVLGSSTTQLLANLASAMRPGLREGDEVVVTDCDHEANIGPWVRLADQGVTVRTWRVRPESLTLELDDLAALLTDRTRLVAVTHASNILGTINPVAEIAAMAHDAGAQVMVDGVSYAPHRAVDVGALDVDFYAFSLYKVYGPHMAALYGKRRHLLELATINHFFVPDDELPRKLQPGAVSYELAHGSGAVVAYLEDLAARTGAPAADTRQGRVAQAYAAIAEHEEHLAERLLAYLREQPGVRIVGDARSHRTVRVPTVSFVADGKDPAAVARHVDGARIGIRYGDFYARRLIETLGLAERNGVVRVSAVHYNTREELDALIARLDEVL